MVATSGLPKVSGSNTRLRLEAQEISIGTERHGQQHAGPITPQ